MKLAVARFIRRAPFAFLVMLVITMGAVGGITASTFDLISVPYAAVLFLSFYLGWHYQDMVDWADREVRLDRARHMEE